MIEPDVRNAIYQLHQQGMSLREISRRLHISRNAVRRIVKQEGKFARRERSDKKQIDPQLLERLYRECDGRMQRIHERLVEEEGLQVGYSTLTRILRDFGLSRSQPVRCDRVPDEPGAEMQHDTSLYRVKFGGQWITVIASLLYLRYSKRRYLRFYRVFTRFVMKCFLHEALMFWEYAAARCIIDNTNLARLRGAGSRAIIVPEMEAFSQRYGFQFVCHALDHPNRKAGNERSFWTVETNFLPGRTFRSLEDLNAQARQWATERMEQRVQTKARVIPAQLFEHERLSLHPLPAHLPAPYQTHQRVTDQYGYVAFGANYYWVPGTRREEVKVLQYADGLKIFGHSECLAEYALPPDGTRHQHYSPAGEPKPRHQPQKRRRDAKLEEQHLRDGKGRVGVSRLRPRGSRRPAAPFHTRTVRAQPPADQRGVRPHCPSSPPLSDRGPGHAAADRLAVPEPGRARASRAGGGGRLPAASRLPGRLSDRPTRSVRVRPVKQRRPTGKPPGEPR